VGVRSPTFERTTSGGAAISISVKILGNAASFDGELSFLVDSSFGEVSLVPYAKKKNRATSAAATGMY
jgi:hypothetical protein